MSEVLKSVADGLESLGQARDYLAYLVRCGEQRPAWQPQHPELTCDQQLRGRLETCHTQLVREQEELKARRAELLQVERANSPLIYPTDVQERIAAHEALQSHVESRDAWLLLKLYCQWRDGPLGRVRPSIERLACPESQFWHSEPGAKKLPPADEWKAINDCVQRALSAAYDERREMEMQHNEALERKVESLLELPTAVADATILILEVNRVRERESAARKSFHDVVERVWLGVQRVSHWVDRLAVEPGKRDRSLAALWARSHVMGQKPQGGSFESGAMESARCAELVALNLYRELYGQAEDLSILQLPPSLDPRWRDADIDTGDIGTGEIWIDVKNARRSSSSRNSYSEHTVKRCKTDPRGRDVKISGFLSPYRGGFYPSEPVVWLGETTLGVIDRLRSDFNKTEYLQLEFDQLYLDRDQRTLFPPWLFEYPPKCYAERDAAIGAIRSDGFILPNSECPLSLLVLAGRVVSTSRLDTLSDEATKFSQRFAAGAKPTRPILFLHILDRFCQTARSGVPFPADELREILFSANSSAVAKFSDGKTPLAVFDPLEVVKSLLDVLKQMAATCAPVVLAFKRFRLRGPSIFQGRKEHGEWQTLFAYCGGWRKLPNGGKAKCGQNPLYLGQNETCDECSKLICHWCGYCAQNCQACPPRQAGWPLP